MKWLILTLFIFCIIPNQSFAASKRSSNTQKKRKKVLKKRKPKAPQSSSYIDETQRFISNFWTNVNYNMDSFFADQQYKRAENNAQILAYLDAYKKEGEDLKTYFDIRIKVDLPKLSRRLSITIEKERDDILDSRSNQLTNSQATKESDYAASVNYKNISNLANTELNSGFRFAIPLDPFVKYSIYKSFNLSWFDLRLEQKFIFFRQEYFSEYTQISFAKKLTDNISISQNNTLSWSDSDDQFVLRDAFVLAQRVNAKITLSYSIGANAKFIPTFNYTSYDAAMSYRQILYKTWLFGSLGVGADFLKSNNWNMTSFAVFRLEILFK